MEEVFWRDKAKTKWHLDGGMNEFVFHKCSKIRKSKNTITHFRTNEGLLHDPDEMAAHAVDYFTNLFFACTPNEFSIVDEVIPFLVDENMNQFLTCILRNLDLDDLIIWPLCPS